MAKNRRNAVRQKVAAFEGVTREVGSQTVDGVNAIDTTGAEAVVLDAVPGTASGPTSDGVITDTARTSWLAQITVADALMIVVGLLAAVLRFTSLGEPLLTPGEAAAALANWQYWQAGTPGLVFASPAYFSLTNLLLATGSSGDVHVRAVPVLFGVLIVLLPWLWRGRVPPLVYLLAGLFMAVSPVLVAVSRTAGGDALALFALLLLFVAGYRQVEGGGRRWGYVTGAAVGLGVTSTPLFYGGLLTLLPAVILAVRRRDEGDTNAPRAAFSAHLVPMAITATVVAGLLSTSFLLYPAGIGVTLRLIPAWLGQFGLPTGGAELLSPFLAALRYEPALLFLGLPAVVWAFTRGRGWERVAALWWCFILVLMLVQPGILADTLLLTLPGYLLIGMLGARLFAASDIRISSGMAWTAFGAILLLGMVLLVAVGRFTRLGLWSGNQGTLVGLATLAFVFAGIVVILALAWDNAPARAGMFVGLAILLLYFMWGSGWRLSREGANDPRERWVSVGTHEEMRTLTALLRGVSRQTVNAENGLSVFSLVDTPALRWYLRDFRQLRVGAALPLDALPDVVIAPEGLTLALPGDYIGAGFALEQEEFESGEPLRVGELLRWWLFRESSTPLNQTRVTLWLRSDLAEAQ